MVSVEKRVGKLVLTTISIIVDTRLVFSQRLKASLDLAFANDFVQRKVLIC